MDPDQTALKGAVGSGSTLFATTTFKVTGRKTKQTTIVVIGALRVKPVFYLNIHSGVSIHS